MAGGGGGVISKNMCTRSLSTVLPSDLFKEMFTRLESRPDGRELLETLKAPVFESLR